MTRQPADPANVTRHSRVRKRLMDAAYVLMSNKGFETSSVADIITAAGVGVGSFYNHYEDKEALARAVFTDRVDEFGCEMERIALGAKDAAAATCLIYRSLIQRATEDKAWAGFILQLEPGFRMFDTLMRPHARIGLRIGISDGTLRVPDLEVAITIKNASLLAAVQGMLAGEMSARSAHASSLYVLRMFGVPEDEAVRLSQMSMPALRRAVGSKTGGRRPSAVA